MGTGSFEGGSWTLMRHPACSHCFYERVKHDYDPCGNIDPLYLLIYALIYLFVHLFINLIMILVIFFSLYSYLFYFLRLLLGQNVLCCFLLLHSFVLYAI